MSKESELMDELFGTTKKWKNKYALSYCDHCECVVILCPDCKNSSCNGGGCPTCAADYEEWSKTKHGINQYLSVPDQQAWLRAQYLKDFIPLCLNEGFTEINWQWLYESGHYSQAVLNLFPTEFEPYIPKN